MSQFGPKILSIFLVAKKALVSMPTALFVALKPSFHIQQVQCVQAFLLKPAPFCKLSASMDSTNKSASSPPLRLSLCSCYFFLSSIFPSIPHSLLHLARTILSFLLFVSDSNGSSEPNHFFRAMIRLMSWLDEVNCFSHLLSHCPM